METIIQWMRAPASGVALLLWVLLVLMVVDFASGTIAAFVTRTVSSQVSARGVARKALILLLLIAAAALERVAHEIPAVAGLPILAVATMGFVVAEFVSIAENAKRAGVISPWLAWVVSRLADGNREQG